MKYIVITETVNKEVRLVEAENELDARNKGWDAAIETHTNSRVTTDVKPYDESAKVE